MVNEHVNLSSGHLEDVTYLQRTNCLEKSEEVIYN
jgi:hypothetical protein